MSAQVKYAAATPYAVGQPVQAFISQALVELRALGVPGASICVMNGESRLVRPLGQGEVPAQGSEVRIDGGAWVAYTGQALPS